jgi:phosphoglycolate phosphatase
MHNKAGKSPALNFNERITYVRYPFCKLRLHLEMKYIKLIIFDLDGTLVDAYVAITKSFNYTMLCLKMNRIDSQKIRRAVGWGDANLLRPFVDPKNLKKALLIYRRHHSKSLIKYSRLFPYAQKVLRFLKKRGYKLAIASNRPTRFSRILIRHLGLNKYFDYILCADRLKHIKPHPQILNKIMDKLHINSSQTLYVADMVIDAKAARAAKIKAVIVTTGSSTKEEIKNERPYRIIRRIADLVNIL